MNTPRRAWLLLPSGRHLDLINPDSLAWTDEDLATRMARTYRWGGESCKALPLSVAQHSLTVLALVRDAAGEPISAAQALLELLHDAEEGWLGVDVLAPLKPFLGQPFKLLSDRLFNAVAQRYKLPHWTLETHARHKRADITAAASEAFHTIGWSEESIRQTLLINHPILESDPLAEIYGCEPWEPWLPAVAMERFLAELRVLMKQAAEEECL